MEYKGFTIENINGHYKVTEIDNPTNTWNEDSIEDAKEAIDNEE